MLQPFYDAVWAVKKRFISILANPLSHTRIYTYVGPMAHAGEYIFSCHCRRHLLMPHCSAYNNLAINTLTYSRV